MTHVSLIRSFPQSCHNFVSDSHADSDKKIYSTQSDTNTEHAMLRYINTTRDNIVTETERPPGGRLNKKDSLTRYGDFHVENKTS